MNFRNLMVMSVTLFWACLSCFSYGAGKDILGPLPIFTAQSFVSASPATSGAVSIRWFDNIGLQFNVGATSPGAVGSFYVDVSEDYNANTNTPGNWIPLNFTSGGAVYTDSDYTGASIAVTVSGPAASAYFRDINQTSAAYMRVRYVPSATGSGVYTVYMTGKSL